MNERFFLIMKIIFFVNLLEFLIIYGFTRYKRGMQIVCYQYFKKLSCFINNCNGINAVPVKQIKPGQI